MPEKKKLKGNLIRITDATVADTIDLELEVSPDKVKSFATDDIYVELDLTSAKEYNLYLPSIDSLGGFLNLNIYVSDIQGTVDSEFALTIIVAEDTDDTIGGQEKVRITSKFSGMYITPLSAKQWGTFYTTNISSKRDDLGVVNKVPAFEPKS
jgi:hypothetical protein